MKEAENTEKVGVRGGTVVVYLLLALIVATWSYSNLPRLVRPAQAGGVVPSAEVNAIPGFRGDAWRMPDDSLLGFVEIPGGPFLMGSDRGDPMAFDNEWWAGGQATVDVPTFYIGRYEVTGAQFRAYLQATGVRGDSLAMSSPADHPVVGVSWTDALSYTRWLDGELRRSPQTPAALRQLLEAGYVVTIPTEAQWEKAARGTDGRTFPWGNAPDRSKANFAGRMTVPVGSFDCPTCAYGLADMSGNVWEWTRSPFQAAPFDPAKDRPDLESDALWVMRGGSFADPDRNARTAVRGGADPGVRRGNIGFRVALSPS